MDQAARIDGITGGAEQARWPTALTDAIRNYLTGAGTLAQVDQAWQSTNNRAPLHSFWRLRILSAPEDGPLDALDLRVLDLFALFGEMPTFLYALTNRDVMPQIADPLRSRGMDEQTIRQHFFSVVGYTFDAQVRFVSLKGNRKRGVKALTSGSKPGAIPGPL